jgi:hypothetical protein
MSLFSDGVGDNEQVLLLRVIAIGKKIWESLGGGLS